MVAKFAWIIVIPVAISDCCKSKDIYSWTGLKNWRHRNVNCLNQEKNNPFHFKTENYIVPTAV